MRAVLSMETFWPVYERVKRPERFFRIGDFFRIRAGSRVVT